jgi:Amt family ammonium transporter
MKSYRRSVVSIFFAAVFILIAINSSNAGAIGVAVPLTASLHQLGNQAIAVIFTAVYAGTITLILFKVVDACVGLRVDIEDESIGLDLTQHGERAYSE